MAGLLTVKETAEVLSVRPSTVRAWILRGENLEVVKVGRAVRITSESLAAFILANTRSPFSERGLGHFESETRMASPVKVTRHLGAKNGIDTVAE
jgi:excisionase family DNA binding protein